MASFGQEDAAQAIAQPLRDDVDAFCNASLPKCAAAAAVAAAPEEPCVTTQVVRMLSSQGPVGLADWQEVGAIGCDGDLREARQRLAAHRRSLGPSLLCRSMAGLSVHRSVAAAACAGGARAWRLGAFLILRCATH